MSGSAAARSNGPALTIPRELASPIRLHHIGGFGFPTDELVSEGRSIAKLGRDGSLKIFFGPGRKVMLADGNEWRIKATTTGRYIVPIVVSPYGTVAMAGPLDGKRSYGITGKEFAYNVVPLGRVGLRKPGLWGLLDRERPVGEIHQRRREIIADEPLPIAAVLLAFTLVAHGIPGEAALLPSYG